MFFKKKKQEEIIAPPKMGVMAKLRTYFFTGMLVTAPATITISLALLVINLVDRKVTRFIPEKYNPETYLPFGLPGLGVLILILVITIIGAFAAGFLGRAALRLWERVMARMPVVSSVYSATKQIFETVLAQQSTAFRQVVMVEYPRRGMWSIGFITGTTKGEIQNLTSQEMVNVFVPTTPNPTSGYLLFIPREDVTVLHMTVEAGIKLVISGGIVTPSDPRPLEKQRDPILDAEKSEKGGLTPIPESE